MMDGKEKEFSLMDALSCLFAVKRTPVMQFAHPKSIFPREIAHTLPCKFTAAVATEHNATIEPPANQRQQLGLPPPLFFLGGGELSVAHLDLFFLRQQDGCLSVHLNSMAIVTRPHGVCDSRLEL